MTSLFAEEDPWSLPGPGRWVRWVVGKLRQRENVLIDLPRCGGPSGLLNEIERVTGRATFARFEEVWLTDLHGVDSASRLLKLLGERLGAKAEVETPSELLDCAPDGGLLVEVDLMSADRQTAAQVVGLVDSVARVFSSVRDRRAPLTFLVIADVDHGVSSLESLQPTTWRSALSPIDAHVFAEAYGGNDERQLDSGWLHVLADVSGTDLELIALALNRKWAGDLSHMSEILEDRWIRRGLSAEEVAATPEQELWRLGCEVQTRTHRPHLNRRALDLPDMRSRLDHEMWRAQLVTIFTSLEHDRTEVIRLARIRGKEPFLKRLSEPNVFGDEVSPEAAEISQLFYHRRLFLDAEPFIVWLRNTRNDLAHGRPIYKRQLEEGSTLRRKLFGLAK